MIQFETLTDETYTMFAMKHYQNPMCFTEEEFRKDLEYVRYVRVAINKFLRHGTGNVEKIINDVILLCNVFGIRPAIKLFEHKLEEDHWTVMKPILLYLGYTTGNDLVQYRMNPDIVDILRNL